MVSPARRQYGLLETIPHEFCADSMVLLEDCALQQIQFNALDLGAQAARRKECRARPIPISGPPKQEPGASWKTCGKEPSLIPRRLVDG